MESRVKGGETEVGNCRFHYGNSRRRRTGISRQLFQKRHHCATHAGIACPFSVERNWVRNRNLPGFDYISRENFEHCRAMADYLGNKSDFVLSLFPSQFNSFAVATGKIHDVLGWFPRRCKSRGVRSASFESDYWRDTVVRGPSNERAISSIDSAVNRSGKVSLLRVGRLKLI